MWFIYNFYFKCTFFFISKVHDFINRKCSLLPPQILTYHWRGLFLIATLEIHYFFINFLLFLLYSSSNDPGAMTNSREIITIISLDMSILPIMTRVALIMDRVKIMTLTIITTRTSLSKVISLIIIKVFVFLCILSEFSTHFKIGFKRGEVCVCVFLFLRKES